MKGKQILVILIGVVAVTLGARYYTETAQEDGTCDEQALEPLPECAQQQRIGSNITVKNKCDFEITVHWDVSGGADHLVDLDPGEEKHVAAFPLKIQAVSCCSQYNRCF